MLAWLQFFNLVNDMKKLFQFLKSDLRPHTDKLLPSELDNVSTTGWANWNDIRQDDLKKEVFFRSISQRMDAEKKVHNHLDFTDPRIARRATSNIMSSLSLDGIINIVPDYMHTSLDEPAIHEGDKGLRNATAVRLLTLGPILCDPAFQAGAEKYLSSEYRTDLYTAARTDLNDYRNLDTFKTPTMALFNTKWEKIERKYDDLGGFPGRPPSPRADLPAPPPQAILSPDEVRRKKMDALVHNMLRYTENPENTAQQMFEKIKRSREDSMDTRAFFTGIAAYIDDVIRPAKDKATLFPNTSEDWERYADFYDKHWLKKTWPVLFSTEDKTSQTYHVVQGAEKKQLFLLLHDPQVTRQMYHYLGAARVQSFVRAYNNEMKIEKPNVLEPELQLLSERVHDALLQHKGMTNLFPPENEQNDSGEYLMDVRGGWKDYQKESKPVIPDPYLDNAMARVNQGESTRTR